MSEDIDFKIVPREGSPVSRSGLHRALGALRQRVTEALQAAGFVFDPTDERATKSRNDNRYTIWNLPYGLVAEDGNGLRSTIQIEMTYAPMRLPPVLLPVSSFVTEANGRPSDILQLNCVSLEETAAEKLVALTRRTAMDLAGLTRGEADPTLVRHIYDLHALRDLVDETTVAGLATEIAAGDAIEFRNQYLAYAENVAGETQKALDALQTDPIHRRRYNDFVSAMVYGERPDFSSALATVVRLADPMQRLSRGTKE
jgi:hypothetical protein